MNIEEQLGVLRKIQHMLLIRDEAASVGRSANAEGLAGETAKLVSLLDPELASLYTRLMAKNRIFLSPLSKGNCSACGLKVPTVKMQHVLGKDRIETCTNCGRILYAPELKATGIRTGQPDPKFLLSRFSTAKLMLPSLKATTPEEAMRELCGALVGEKVIAEAEPVVAAALEREKMLTTAVGNGLAFPHVRGMEEGVLTFACGVSPTGIAWGGQCVKLVFFTVLPVIASPFYLKLMAAFAKTFEDGEKLPFLIASGDAKALWKELNKATRVAVKNL